jgi:hypothetical protein
MFSHAHSTRLVTALLACSLLTTGCYSRVPIRPSELPKLNGSFQEAQAVGPNATLVIQSVRQVEGEDGRLVEFQGEHDVIVTLQDGSKTTYKHPVLVSEESGVLTIRSGNLTEARVPLAAIKRVEATEYDTVKTILATLGATVGGSVLALIVLFT